MTAVTVVLTFFNSRKYIEPALEQVLAQSFTDFELIVVDDGSTDGTASALAEKLEDLDKARLIRNEVNLGIAESRNRAVAAASGDYVWFVDCDDLWSDKILETLVRAVESSEADVAVCGAIRVTHAGQHVGKPLDGGIEGVHADADAVRLLLTGRIRGYLWNKVIRRELLRTYPFPRLSSQSDFSTVCDIVFSGAKFVFVAETLYRHVERTGSITNSRISSFGNLASSLERVERGVAGRADARQFDEALSYFRQWFYRSSVVNTSIRLGVTDAALKEHAKKLRRLASIKEIMLTRRFSRREAAIAFGMRFGGPLYPAAYRAYLRKVSAS